MASTEFTEEHTLTQGRRRPPSWSRRALGYLLRVVLPWSLLAQALGTLVAGNSWPLGIVGQLVGVGAFVLVIVVSVAFSRDGQSWSSRLLLMRACDLAGHPVSRTRLAAREVAHLADVMSLGIGFLWPLWDPRRQTLGDKLAGTQVWMDYPEAE